MLNECKNVLIKSIYKYNCTYSYFPYCFVEYDDTNGISDFDSNGTQLKQERLSILKNYFSESLVHKVAQQESKIDTLLKTLDNLKDSLKVICKNSEKFCRDITEARAFL